MSDSLRTKLLRTDLEAWNHPRYVYLGGPAFAVLGTIVGQSWGVHLSGKGFPSISSRGRRRSPGSRSSRSSIERA